MNEVAEFLVDLLIIALDGDICIFREQKYLIKFREVFFRAIFPRSIFRVASLSAFASSYLPNVR